MKPSIGLRMTAVALTTLGLAAGLQTASPAGAGPKPHYKVGVESDAPLPAALSPDQLPPSEEPISIAADTPDGFKLRNPGVRSSDYVYTSDTVYQGAYNCNATVCTLAAEVTARLKQTAIGGSSHTWQLTMNMARSRNPGGLTWSHSSTYWCGVNESLSGDRICDASGAAPSNASMSVNTLVNKPWGSANSITVFPMVQANTIFSNGVTVSTKFRGWDTLSRSSTTMLRAGSDGA